jgi:hypothetical protein
VRVFRQFRQRDADADADTDADTDANGAGLMQEHELRALIEDLAMGEI